MRKALGRGLGALFPDGSQSASVLHAPHGNGLHEHMVPVGQIRPNPSQPRHGIGGDEVRALAESIRQHGMIQPLLVRSVEGGFEIIAGERRWRAAEQAGLERVPVVVREATDAESFELALIENLQREDLSPLEEAAAYCRLMEEFGLTQEQVAERVGKSRVTVANLVRLLGLPKEVKDQIASGALTMGHARAVLAAPTAARQIALAREIAQRGISVREAERLAARPAGDRHRRAASAADVHTRAIQDELCRLLGTRVRLLPRGRGGTIEISYHCPEERERLLDILRGQAVQAANVL